MPKHVPVTPLAPRTLLHALLGVACAVVAAPGAAAEGVDLTRLSLAELLDVDITTVFKKPSRAFDTPAAVHVITNEDIRRSGVTSIAEALRLAPGLHVARIDANKWAISARGFNDRFTEKLLVLMDGRSVYTPMFNGVYWDIQDTLLEDVDRIEVILGPGGTSWGANAVNGVINVITKSAANTLGGYVEAGAGSDERAFAGGRYGTQLGEVDLRVYAKGRKIDDLTLAGGGEAEDHWSSAQAGFRADWAGASTRITAQGDYFYTDKAAAGTVLAFDPPFAREVEGDYDVHGGNLLLRAERSLDDGGELSLQGYVDNSDRRDPFTIGLDRRTLDFEFEHRFPLGASQEFNYGLGYRRIDFSANPTESIQAPPTIDHLDLFSAFVQDEIRMLDDRLRLTFGSKIEHHTITGLEFLPSARLAWLPTERQTLWVAVSRAVRVPGVSEFDGPQSIFPDLSFQTVAPGVTLPVFIEGQGVGMDDAENLTALEAGFRSRHGESFSTDLSLFYFRYSDLSTGVQDPPRFRGCDLLQVPFVDCVPTAIVVPIRSDATARSQTRAESYGLELSARWRVRDDIRLRAWYGFQNDKVDAPPGALPRSRAGTSPRHQLTLSASFDLPRNLEFDVWGRFVDRLRSLSVPGYATANARLGWTPAQDFTLSLVGQNLLSSRHAESAGNVFIGGDPSEVERGVYLKASYRF